LVAFASRSKLVPDSSGPEEQVFIRDVLTGITERASAGVTEPLDFDQPALGADGRSVAFRGYDPRLGPDGSPPPDSGASYSRIGVRGEIGPPSGGRLAYLGSHGGNPVELGPAERVTVFRNRVAYLGRDRQGEHVLHLWSPNGFQTSGESATAVALSDSIVA